MDTLTQACRRREEFITLVEKSSFLGHTYKLPLEPTKLHFSPFGIKHQKEDREKESVAYWKRVRGLHLPLHLGLPIHGQSWYDNYPHAIASFVTIDHLFLPLVLDTQVNSSSLALVLDYPLLGTKYQEKETLNAQGRVP